MKRIIFFLAGLLSVCQAFAQPLPIVTSEHVDADSCSSIRVYHPHYYTRVELFNSEKPIKRKNIVFLGNSLTEGGKWSELLGKKNIRNRGIIGDVAMGVYDRLYQILPGQPKKLFFLIGVNDVSHDLTVDSIVTAITQVIDRIQQESPKTKLYLQSLLPINESFGRYKRMIGKTDTIPKINKRLEVIAKERNIPFINLYPLFTMAGTNVLREELTGDGLHLNDEGYKIWAKELKPYL